MRKEILILGAASLLLLVCSCSKREEMIIASELRLPEMFSDWEMPMYLYKTSTDYYTLIKVISKEKKQSENLPGKRSPYLDYGDNEGQ